MPSNGLRALPCAAYLSRNVLIFMNLPPMICGGAQRGTSAPEALAGVRAVMANVTHVAATPHDSGDMSWLTFCAATSMT